MLDFLQNNWELVKNNPLEFIVFGVSSAALGAWATSFLRAAQLDTMRERLEGKGDQIERLQNDVSNLDELPRMREELAKMRLELDEAANTDYLAIYKQARDSTTSATCDELEPTKYIVSLFDESPATELTEALKTTRNKNKTLFAIIYDPNHPSKSKLKYAAGYFLEYATTRKIIEDKFVVALLSNDNPEVAKLVPDDDPLDKARWVVLNSKGHVLHSESFYANPDEGLKRTRRMVEEITSNEGI